ncbi:MAG: hypothetical protein RML95_03480 [Anaerolineae bacterium]|nr:hypothetical protein [Anaerolineae bacterium]
MRRWLWRFRLVTALCFLTVGMLQSAFLAVAAGRARQDYGCLTFDSKQGTRVLDVGTGAVMLKRQISPPKPSAYLESSQWQVYQLDNTLRLLRRANGRAYTLQINGNLQGAAFSPDERWLVYSWYDMPNRRLALTLVDLQSDASDTPSLRQIELPESSQTWSWSPKSKLLRVRREDGKAFMLWSAADERAHVFSANGTVDYHRWLPDNAEQKVAYSTYRENGSQREDQLHIADLTGVRASYALAMPPDQLLWSPHDRYLALTIPLFPRWQIAVADAEGNWHDVALVAQRGDALSLPLVFWSADGETLFYLQDEGASPLSWHWIAYRVAERSHHKIVRDVVKRPNFSRTDPQQAVFIWSEQGKRNATLMRLDGSQRVALAEAADDMGDPYWSSDGQYVALVWATGQDARRVVRLTVANAETGAVQTLSDGLWDARDLRWLAGSESLFFIAARGGEDDQPVYSAELLVPSTGEQRVLLSGKEAIGTALWQGQAIEFWWRTGQTLGISRHAPNGDTVFAHSVVDEGITPVLNDILFFSDQSFIVQPPFPQVFPAPNSGVLALKVGSRESERLYIVMPDGSWRLVRTDLSGLGDPLWSPNGAYMAFTQSVNRGQVTLEIVKANGAQIRRVEGYDGIFRRLKWTRCGYSR